MKHTQEPSKDDVMKTNKATEIHLRSRVLNCRRHVREKRRMNQRADMPDISSKVQNALLLKRLQYPTRTRVGKRARSWKAGKQKRADGAKKHHHSLLSSPMICCFVLGKDKRFGTAWNIFPQENWRQHQDNQ